LRLSQPELAPEQEQQPGLLSRPSTGPAVSKSASGAKSAAGRCRATEGRGSEHRRAPDGAERRRVGVVQFVCGCDCQEKSGCVFPLGGDFLSGVRALPPPLTPEDPDLACRQRTCRRFRRLKKSLAGRCGAPSRAQCRCTAGRQSARYREQHIRCSQIQQRGDLQRLRPVCFAAVSFRRGGCWIQRGRDCGFRSFSGKRQGLGW